MLAESNSHFPVKLRLRIDWSEMDLFGHVNNVAFFKYIQASRVNYWETIGLTCIHAETNIGPVLASASCRFKKPLHYPGSIAVEASVDHIGNSSFRMQHRILDEKNEIAAEAEDIIVLYDFNKNEKVSFTPELRAAIEKVENRKF